MPTTERTNSQELTVTGAALVPLPVAGADITGPVAAPSWAASAVALLLADSRSVETQRAYARDLADFWKFAERDASDLAAAVRWLCQDRDAGSLALLLNGYKASLRERALAEATINRRLAAVKALIRKARQLGATCDDPAGLVKSEKVTAYRDTRGPALSAAAQLLGAPDRSTIQGRRDYCLLLFLCENALRRGECARCDCGDFDAKESRLSILGKGRGTQKEAVTLSPVTVAAVVDYLATRSDVGEVLTDASPLFATLGRGTRTADGRLTGESVTEIVAKYGRKVLGRDLHAHSLRHMAITAILDATGGDVRTAQRLSRHKDLRTLQIYDDNREDLQGRATLLLSDLLKKGQGKGNL